MNINNLQAIAKHIRTIDPEKFYGEDYVYNFEKYRVYDPREIINCGGKADAIGHSVVLDLGDNLIPFGKYSADGILTHFDYEAWVKNFTDLQSTRVPVEVYARTNIVNSRLYAWCFGSAWNEYQDSFELTADRIDYLVKNGDTPVGFSGYSSGMTKDCYESMMRAIEISKNNVK